MAPKEKDIVPNMNAKKIFALKVASREKAMTLNLTADLYPEVLL
jgi:hypothetical protein